LGFCGLAGSAEHATKSAVITNAKKRRTESLPHRLKRAGGMN
jgi:hypothetical protein